MRISDWSSDVCSSDLVSTGQEAYSMAMLIAEQGAKWAGWQVDIVGTDVSHHAIGRARVGLYTQFEIQRGLPVQRMVRWFDQTEGGWLAKADLRRRIDFRCRICSSDRKSTRLNSSH